MAALASVPYFIYILSMLEFFAKVKSEEAVTVNEPGIKASGNEQETPVIYRWRQHNYTGEESVDLTSLEDALQPVILTSANDGDDVNLTVTYMARINSTPYWDFKFDGVSYTITQGQMVNNGTHISSSITLPVTWKNNQYLGFRISTEIGVYYTELDFKLASTRWIDYSVPRLGIKMNVPNTFDSTVNVTATKTKKLNNTCFEYSYTVGLLNFVDGVNGGVTRIRGVGTSGKKETDAYKLTEYGIRQDYEDLHSEVVLYSACNFKTYDFYTFSIFKDTRLVKYSRKNSAADEDKVNITFVESIYGVQDVMNFDEAFAYRSISCEAFGTPKPHLTIQDKAGVLLQTVELKQTTSMSSHVIASLDNIPLEQAVGNYTCTATAGTETITRTIEVVKVARPEILLAEVVVNNTEEIIAVCMAKGNPVPSISFSVNYAKDDVIEKRPILETEATVKMWHKSKYTRTGADSVDEWFKYKAERCPKPESTILKKLSLGPDVIQKIIALKPLPFLSRQQINRLFCRADGYDNVYVTQEVSLKLSSWLNNFMRHVSKLTFMKVFG